MTNLVTAAKIADMATGWLAGQAARDFTATDEKMLSHFDIEDSEEFKTTKYFLQDALRYGTYQGGGIQLCGAA